MFWHLTPAPRHCTGSDSKGHCHMTYVPALDRYDAMLYRRCGRSGVKLPLS